MEKQRVLLAQEGTSFSAKSIDQGIGSPSTRGVLGESEQPRKTIRWPWDHGLPVAQLQFSHYFHRPNFSQGNGPIERSFRTEEEEFYPVEDLPASLEEHLRDDAYHQA